MNTQAYNLLWIRPNFAERGEQFRQPILSKTIENIRIIAEQNSNVDVRLWVDSKRMSEAQMQWLKDMVGETLSGNMSLQDLRTIPEYNSHYLYNQTETSRDWQLDKHSLVWRQVDAAKILVCLQGEYDQEFYSDADVVNLRVNSKEVQSRLRKHGIILGGGIGDSGYAWYENQSFGIDRRGRSFFRTLYDRTVREVMRGENGYGSYIDLINSELKGKMGIDTKEIVFQSRYDGTVALHPEGNNQQLDGGKAIQPEGSYKPIEGEG